MLLVLQIDLIVINADDIADVADAHDDCDVLCCDVAGTVRFPDIVPIRFGEGGGVTTEKS
jgi:hypothetical protein